MKKLKRQFSLEVSDLQVREAEGEQKSRTIEGYAVVFGVRSVNLTPWSSEREVYEIMEPGCITPDLLTRSDVVLTDFHDNTAILGRWRSGQGTLSLELDQRGMKIRCTLAETARAIELLSAIERGDITGMSFAFTADEEDNINGVAYEKTAERTTTGKVIWLRHVRKVTGLYDVTIAGHPAYEQTSIEAREISDILDEKLRECGDEEEKKRACGDNEEEKREDEEDKTEDTSDDKSEEPDKEDKTDDQDEEDKKQRQMTTQRLRAHRRHQNEINNKSFNF